MQETMLDPWIEEVMEGYVREMGGGAYAQALGSTLGQAGRESLSGAFSVRTKSQMTQEQFDTYLSDQNYNPEHDPDGKQLAKLTNDFQEDVSGLRKAASYAFKAFSVVTMFATLVSAATVAGGVGASLLCSYVLLDKTVDVAQSKLKIRRTWQTIHQQQYQAASESARLDYRDRLIQELGVRTPITENELYSKHLLFDRLGGKQALPANTAQKQQKDLALKKEQMHALADIFSAMRIQSAQKVNSPAEMGAPQTSVQIKQQILAYLKTNEVRKATRTILEHAEMLMDASKGDLSFFNQYIQYIIQHGKPPSFAAAAVDPKRQQLVKDIGGILSQELDNPIFHIPARAWGFIAKVREGVEQSHKEFIIDKYQDDNAIIDMVLKLMYDINTMTVDDIQRYKKDAGESDLQAIQQQALDTCKQYVYESYTISEEFRALFEIFSAIAMEIGLEQGKFVDFTKLSTGYLKGKQVDASVFKILKGDTILSRKDVYQIGILIDEKVSIDQRAGLKEGLATHFGEFWAIKHSDLLQLIHFPTQLKHRYLGRDMGIDPETVGLYNEELFNELDRLGIEYDRSKTIGILRQQGGINPNKITAEKYAATGKLEYDDYIVRLELGDLKEGMIHILDEHKDEFKSEGYEDDVEIVKLILNNIKDNVYIRDPNKGMSYVYKFLNENGEVKYLRVWKKDSESYIRTAYIVKWKDQIKYLDNLFEDYNL